MPVSGVCVRAGVAVPIPSPVAALDVPLREYSEFSVRYFALQRLLLVCPVLARNSTTAMPPHRDSEYDRFGHYLFAFMLPRTTLILLVASPGPLSLSQCNVMLIIMFELQDVKRRGMNHQQR